MHHPAMGTLYPATDNHSRSPMKALRSRNFAAPSPATLNWRNAAVLAVLAAGSNALLAAAITVPNGSFESQTALPTYPYITTLIDSWQKAPKPDWFNETTSGIYWDQTAGLFQNTPLGFPNHIDNMDGNQGLYVMTIPQVALFQDYDTIAWNQSAPSHAFDATYEVGKAYRFTLGVIGGLGGMTPGASLELAMYYRDAGNQPVTIAATPVVFDPAVFPSGTHFLDFSVGVPYVQAGDAWAGQHIGLRLLSTSGDGASYWDLDNARLTVVPEPATGALLGLGLAGLWLARNRRMPCA
jgi:hypothetical protein